MKGGDEPVPAEAGASPPVVLRADEIEAMLAPVLGAAPPRAIERVRGGLINTIYRVTTDRADLVVRVYAGGLDAYRVERALLAAVAPTLPVPEVVHADASGRICAAPYIVYRWIDGIALNECRRTAGPAALQALAEPLGAVAARVAALVPAECVPSASLRARSIADALPRTDDRLRRGRARDRLGGALADALADRLADQASALVALDARAGLVHGDFGGRNLLVRRAAGDSWTIAGVIDWESAVTGAAFWDLGSLFRYSRRYPAAFVDGFARGYHAAGGALPDGWSLTARLLDGLVLVGILDLDRDLPGVFAECRGLVADLLADTA